MLAKKWKREKAVIERDRDNKDWKDAQQAEKKEKFLGCQQTRRTQDAKIQ